MRQNILDLTEVGEQGPGHGLAQLLIDTGRRAEEEVSHLVNDVVWLYMGSTIVAVPQLEVVLVDRLVRGGRRGVALALVDAHAGDAEAQRAAGAHAADMVQAAALLGRRVIGPKARAQLRI